MLFIASSVGSVNSRIDLHIENHSCFRFRRIVEINNNKQSEIVEIRLTDTLSSVPFAPWHSVLHNLFHPEN